MTRLDALCQNITDGKHGDCKDEEGSGFFFISCKDVREGSIDYSQARQITQGDFLDTHRRTRLEPEDILITNSGTIGRMALVRRAETTSRTTFQKSVAILKPDRAKVVPRWFYYALAANMSALVGWAGGTAQKNLLLRDLRAFDLEVPSLSTQRKIAAMLSAYDNLIENNLRRIRILEEMAQALYREWFVEFRFPGHKRIQFIDSPLGRIPEGWEVADLGAVAEEVRRGVSPRDIPKDTPYFGLEHLPRKAITLSDWGTASDVASTKLAFKKGEILFGKIRPYFHKVGVAPLDGVCSSDTIVIRTPNERFYSVVVSLVSSDEFVEHATKTSQGTKMPRADWKVLKTYPVLVPGENLLGKFSAFFLPTLDLLQNLMFRNRSLRHTRDLLLPRLISGDLDVSDIDIAVREDAA